MVRNQEKDTRRQSQKAMAMADEARIEQDRKLAIDQRLEETFALCKFISELAESTQDAVEHSHDHRRAQGLSS